MKCFHGMMKIKALHLFIKNTEMFCTYFKIEKSCNACEQIIQKGKTVFYLHFMAMFHEIRNQISNSIFKIVECCI